MDLRSTVGMGTISIVIKPLLGRRKSMSTTQSGRPNKDTASQPARDDVPRRLIVTASVAIFAIRDWALWGLLRDGPGGPPTRLVLGSESLTDAVGSTIDARM